MPSYTRNRTRLLWICCWKLIHLKRKWLKLPLSTSRPQILQLPSWSSREQSTVWS
jgi:hypothetical protein